MRPEDEVVIHITTDNEIHVETKKKGTESFKLVSPQSIVDSLKNSIKYTLRIESGLLPHNCIAFNGDDCGNRFVAIVFDEKRADVVLEKTQYKDFPLPRLVFGFEIDAAGSIRRVKLGVTEQGRLTPKSRMFIYPFSNVNGFHLCTGSNTFPRIKSPHQLNGLPYFILSMPNNYDWYNNENTKLHLNCRELFEHMKDRDSGYYYSDVLKDMGKTLNDFLTEGGRI